MKTIEMDRGTLKEFRNHITRINARASKLNVPPITYQETGSRIVRWKSEHSSWITHAAEMVTVEVSDNTVVLNGWEFVAVCEKVGDDSIIRTFAEVDLSSFRGRDDCEHCGRNIRRKYLIVFRDVSTGELKLVGRSCARDYIGHPDAEAVARMLQRVYEYVEDFEDQQLRRSEPGYAIERLVAKSRAVIRHFGWVSAREAYEDPWGKVSTADIIKADGKESREAEVTAEDDAVALKAVEWAAGLPAEGQSDYLNNLRVLAQLGVVYHRHVGLAVSLIRAYQSQMDRQAQQERAATSPSTHVGQVGSRIETELKAISFRTMGPDPYTPHANRALVKFSDAEGNVYVWWTTDSTNAYSQLDNDKPVTVRATILRHGEYHGEKQTTLARLNIRH